MADKDHKDNRNRKSSTFSETPIFSMFPYCSTSPAAPKSNSQKYSECASEF